MKAYHDRQQNEKSKQIEDRLYANGESSLNMRLSGQLFIEKKNYGPLKFDIKEIRDRYNLRINEDCKWVISAVNEKEKCPRTWFHQPKLDPELLETHKLAVIVYSKFALPLEGLAACLLSIFTHDM